MEIKTGDLEFNLNHFFRYLYGGFILSLVLAVVVFPTVSSAVVDSLAGLGAVVITLCVIAVGTGFYVLYKIFISELLVDKLVHFIVAHPIHANKCAFKYLEHLGVTGSDKLTAWRAIFYEKLNKEDKIQKIFFLRHSEIHVLYQTFSACLLGVAALLLFRSFLEAVNEKLMVLGILGGLFLIAGIYSDLKLCHDERSYFVARESDIKESLKKAKLLP